MANTTQYSERSQSVKQLLDQGFRVVYSSPSFTCLCLQRTQSTFFIAQVQENGEVNTKPLSEFLKDFLE
jgi:hypothetical protein